MKYARQIIGLLVMTSAVIGYGEYRHRLLANQLKESATQLASTMASTTAEFESKIKGLDDKLAKITNENATLNSGLQSEQSKSSTFQEQIGKIYDTVGTLDKLSKIDPQLLQKYSKVYFLNEHYAPTSLVDIDAKYLSARDKPVQIQTKVWSYLEKLLSVAIADGTNLQISSGYRSFGTQSSLKLSYKFTYGAGAANQFSADQGYSEHQLGTTVDFTTPSVGATLSGFEMTSAYKWLVDNAYKYGFTLSYPEKNKYYEYEPWHWRFVGVDLANKLHRENKYFYDLEQREINDYLLLIFN